MRQKGRRANARPSDPNADYERITATVIAALEAGTVPWRQMWRVAEAPRNIDGYRYRGINVVLLRLRGYGSPYWLTYNQAKARGGYVRKDEKGTEIILWRRIRVKDEEAKDGYKVVPLLKIYNVFNVEQCADVRLPRNAIASVVPSDDRSAAIAAAEAIVVGYADGPHIDERGTAASYTPSWDVVQVPPRGDFESLDAFYATEFHELAHSTGHVKRLNRKGVAETARFGTYTYGREELVAELASAFLCGEAEILPQTIENAAAYIASWIRTIREDPRAVVVAAGAAQRAADLILGRVWEEAAPVEAAETPA